MTESKDLRQVYYCKLRTMENLHNNCCNKLSIHSRSLSSLNRRSVSLQLVATRHKDIDTEKMNRIIYHRFGKRSRNKCEKTIEIGMTCQIRVNHIARMTADGIDFWKKGKEKMFRWRPILDSWVIYVNTCDEIAWWTWLNKVSIVHRQPDDRNELRNVDSIVQEQCQCFEKFQDF